MLLRSCTYSLLQAVDTRNVPPGELIKVFNTKTFWGSNCIAWNTRVAIQIGVPLNDGWPPHVLYTLIAITCEHVPKVFTGHEPLEVRCKNGIHCLREFRPSTFVYEII